MKTQLESEDIQAISSAVIEMLKPMLCGNDKYATDDRWFNVKQLSEYIGMSPQWIYNNKSKLPHVNINNKPLFRKSEVDHWLESCRVNTDNEPIELPVVNGRNHKNEIHSKGFNHQKR